MGPLDFIFGLVFLGTVTGIIRMIVYAVTGRAVRDGAGGGKRKALAAELRAAEDRVRGLEAQLLDARLQNDQLQKQLEWHTKLLEAQDRLVAQLPTSATRAAVQG
jgi:hypothetical protein